MKQAKGWRLYAVGKKSPKFAGMLRIFCILLVISLFALTVFPQTEDTSSLFSMGLKVHRSFIIQHTQMLSDEVTSSHPWMIETDFNWHLRKRVTWDYCNCYPRTGFSFLYTNFDLPGILGDAISAYAFIEPFINSERRFNYSIRFGLGPTYLTTLYDEVSNPDNLFFSSHVSFIAVLNASVNYRATPRLTLRAAGNYNHISNGGYSEPNLGINFPSVSLGFDYSFHDIRLPFREPLPSKNSLDKKHNFDLFIGLSAKPTSKGLREKRYPVYAAGANYSFAVNTILALNGGLEWTSDRSIYRTIRQKGTVDENGDPPDHNRFASLIGIDWLFGQFIFYQHFGIYLYSPVKARDPVYQRYGLSFLFSEHIFGGFNIKAHGQDADFMDVRLGYRF